MSKTYKTNFKSDDLRKMCQAICIMSNRNLRFSDCSDESSIGFISKTQELQSLMSNCCLDVYSELVSCNLKNLTARYHDILMQIQHEKAFRTWKSAFFVHVPDFETIEELQMHLAIRGYCCEI